MSETADSGAGQIGDKDLLEALVSAMSGLRDDMRAMSQSAHRVVTQGTVAVSAAIGVLFAQELFDNDTAFVVVGVVVAVVMFFLLVVALAMHSRYAIDQIQLAALEREANALVGVPLLLTHQPETRGTQWWDGDFLFTFVVVFLSLLAHIGLLWFVGVRSAAWIPWTIGSIEFIVSVLLVGSYWHIVTTTKQRVASAYAKATVASTSPRPS